MEHDPAVIAGVCLVAEKAIMRAIDLSAGTRNQLKGLHPLTIGVNCSSPSVDLFVTVETDGGVAIASYREEATTVSLAGSWKDFLAVAAADDPASALINGNVQISGDTAPLLQLQAVLADLDIDWEAPLVETLGPVAGHQLAAVIRRLHAHIAKYSPAIKAPAERIHSRGGTTVTTASRAKCLFLSRG